MAAFVESAHLLARVVKPHAPALLEGVGQLPLHSAVQLLLTTVHATRPEVYQHALVSMALAGALSAAAGQARFDLRMALLTGLLHDMGEMYLDPRCRRDDCRGERCASAPAARCDWCGPCVAKASARQAAQR
jgi:hypothetical protein